MFLLLYHPSSRTERCERNASSALIRDLRERCASPHKVPDSLAPAGLGFRDDGWGWFAVHTSRSLEAGVAALLKLQRQILAAGLADGALVGIISIGDVVKDHVAEVEMEATAMRDYIAHS